MIPLATKEKMVLLEATQNPQSRRNLHNTTAAIPHILLPPGDKREG